MSLCCSATGPRQTALMELMRKQRKGAYLVSITNRLISLQNRHKDYILDY